MKRGIQGTLLLKRTPAESFSAFVPRSLPPEPPISVDSEMQDLIERANRALGRLDGITMLIPDIWLFLYYYVRKEAVLSSQIEGTQSTLSDLLLFESKEVPGVPLNDVQEVSNYVAAMTHGLKRIKEGFPLSLRLLREIHEKLLAKGRGSSKGPGEFRSTQNWVGGSRPGNAEFVPPPPGEVVAAMGALELFLHNKPSKTPLLMKAALAHVQFESIHPFQDGNGRLGRLLISLLMCSEGALSEPLLYLSLYFKRNRRQYFELLQDVRMEGEWERWLAFFLEGVIETSEQAVETARRILALFEEDRKKIEKLGSSSGSALRVHHLLQKKVYASISSAVGELKLTYPTVSRSIDELVKLTIVQEVTGQKRGRIFAYGAYLRILSEGTEPLRDQPQNAGIASGHTLSRPA
ncbi:MAG: Fic family protein [Candidatus Dormibacter sp.]